ncbi:MAG: Gfo/Idh/MocA family oxidoreductase [Actinomycetota bacterium]
MNAESADDVVRFGVLGAARIAPKALLLPAAKLDGVEVTVVAARDRGRAEAFAAEHGIGSVVDGYADVIVSDEVDVVYNPLPMSLHAEWTIAALRAGKHVLCEKPFASNAAEAAEMVRVAEETGLVLGEAFHYRYHPMFERILGEVASGRIGRLRRVEGRFQVPIGGRPGTVDQPDIRWDFATSGGSLMDLGCYPMSWVRHVTGEEPEVVSASAVEGPPNVDASIEAELRFPSGATGLVASAMEGERRIELVIEGTEGSIEAVNPMAPQMGNTLTVTTAAGRTSGPIEAGISYDHMLRAFVDHLVLGSPFPTRGTDSVANMAAIDAVYAAAGLPLRGTASP